MDTSLFEAGIMQTYWQAAGFLASGAVPRRLGSGHPLTAPYQAFRTRDGWIIIGASNQANYERLLKALDAPELAADPRFRTNVERMMNREALIEALTAHLKARDTAEWIAELEKTGMPVGPILSLPEVLAHPQTLAREMVIETEHSRIGKTKSLGLPIKFSETPGEVKRAAPVLGEHIREVLRETGYSGKEIEELLREGAVVAAD